MKQLISWLRREDASSPELSESQQRKLGDSAWRSSNSKWNYIVWFSLGLYAGFLLIYQAARAGSGQLARLGIVHIAGFIAILPLIAIGSSNLELYQYLFLPVSLFWGLVGVLFTHWANPTVLKSKASRLIIFDAVSGERPAVGDIRSDGSDKGPRKLDL